MSAGIGLVVDAPDARILPAESVIYAELEDEAVLLQVDRGIYFGLDETGTRIWQLLSDGRSQAEIVDVLLAEYDADPATLRADVRALLEHLSAQGLIRVEGR